MAKVAEQLIANIKGAGSLDELYSMLSAGSTYKNPHRERMKRIASIEAEYGQNTDTWPAEILSEHDTLCRERDRHEAEEFDQFQFEAMKRL
ncbi:MAG: hypothetical protein RR308_01035 [Hafnia sp.]